MTHTIYPVATISPITATLELDADEEFDSRFTPQNTAWLDDRSAEDEDTKARELTASAPVTGSATLSADRARGAAAAEGAATGVDSLRLFFPVRPWRRPDFHLIPRHQARGRDFGEGVLWKDPQGGFGYGSLAVCRRGAFRFRVAPVGTEIRLRAFFSAPAVAAGNNAFTLDAAGLRCVLETMQRQLYEVGLEVDWREGQLSRVDVHRDVALPRPFSSYLPALHLLEPRYGRLFQNYESGVVRGAATSLVYNLYDKRAERLHRGRPVPETANASPGWMRCEARLPTAAAARKHLGMCTAGQLVDRYDELGPWLDARVIGDLCSEPVPDYIGYPKDWPITTRTPDDDEWWDMMLKGEAATFADRLALIALRLGYEKLGPQRFWELARQGDREGQVQASKLRAHFRQTALHSFSDQLLPVALLYAELRRALLGAT